MTDADLIARDDALRVIADRIKARDTYVISVHPDGHRRVPGLLDALGGSEALIDGGLDVVFVARSGEVANVVGVADELLGLRAVAVLLAPKALNSAAKLSRLFGQEVPADGSQDLIMATVTAGGAGFPTLLVDALDEVDPIVASQIRAAGTTR